MAVLTFKSFACLFFVMLCIDSTMGAITPATVTTTTSKSVCFKGHVNWCYRNAAHLDFALKKESCSMLTSMDECIDQILSVCDLDTYTEARDALQMAKAQLGRIMAFCDTNVGDTCVHKAHACLEWFETLIVIDGTAVRNADNMCTPIDVALGCLWKLVPVCAHVHKTDEEHRIQARISALVAQQTEYKCASHGNGIVHSKKCDSGIVSDCTKGLGSMDYTDKATTCPLLMTMEKCLKDVGSVCTVAEKQKNEKEQNLFMLQGMMAMCAVKLDDCFIKAEACLSPFEEIQNKTNEASKFCPVVQSSAKCLIKLLKGCKNENTKTSVETSISGLVHFGTTQECKDAGYEVKGRKVKVVTTTGPSTEGNSTAGPGGAGVTTKPAVAILLLSAILTFLAL